MARVLKEYFGEVHSADAFAYGHGEVRDFLAYPFETNAFDWVIPSGLLNSSSWKAFGSRGRAWPYLRARCSSRVLGDTTPSFAQDRPRRSPSSPSVCLRGRPS
jgi:hypothetical protein